MGWSLVTRACKYYIAASLLVNMSSTFDIHKHCSYNYYHICSGWIPFVVVNVMSQHQQQYCVTML